MQDIVLAMILYIAGCASLCVMSAVLIMQMRYMHTGMTWRQRRLAKRVMRR